VTGGASNDFEAANKIATAMVTRWGMGRDPEASDGGISGRGSLSFLVPTGDRLLPSEVQAAATRAIRAILDDAYADACRTLIEHMETLRRCSAYLVEHERVDGETFDELFDGRRVVPKAEDEWRAATARPRAWGDIVDLAARRVAAIKPAPASVPAVAVANVAATPPDVAEPAFETPAAISGVAPATLADEPVASIATISDAPVAAMEAVAAAPTPAAPSPATPSPRSRLRVRRTPARRARRAAASMLGRAERWLRSGELEADRL
jgi:Peptidase family M41